MSKQQWPTVRERKTKVKSKTYTYYYVDLGIVDGKRKTKNFKKDKKAAELWAEKKRRERNKIGSDALRLADEQKREAVHAFKKLKNVATLTDAVDFYLDHHGPDGRNKTIKELYQEYLESRIKAQRRERTIRDIRQRLGAFAGQFGDIPVRQVSTHDLERWLDAKGGNGVSRNNYRVHLVGLFNFARKRQYVTENRAAVIERVKKKKQKPYILTPNDVEKLLNCTQANADDMLPYFALCTFAGIRPEECKRLDWQDIDFSKKNIYIGADISKTGDERYVDMADNLIQWILPYNRKAGKIFYSNHQFKKIREKAGIRWKADCLRHSYGSYHLAMYENAGKTALQMGHRQLSTLFDHYRNAIKDRKDAEDFWNIHPRRKSNVIVMEKTA